VLQVDCYAARILIERFFLVATLFKQTEPGRRWQIFSGPLIDPCNFKRQLGKDLVEVITADRRGSLRKQRPWCTFSSNVTSDASNVPPPRS